MKDIRVNNGDFRPRLRHDCNRCTLLGYVRSRNIDYDVYRCIGDDPTIILRYGNEGQDYNSFHMSIVETIAKSEAGENGGKYASAYRLVQAYDLLNGR